MATTPGDPLMSAENFETIINEFLTAQPFRVLVIELHGGTRYEIDHPKALLVRGSAAIFWRPGGGPVMFDHDSVNQIYLGTASELAAGTDAA